MESPRWLVGMELARARAGSATDGGAERADHGAALARAGDAYEHARRGARRGPRGEPAPPGWNEAVWRAVGRLLARALAPAPALRRAAEDRLLAGLPPTAGPGDGSPGSPPAPG